jgi:hypothetical protein
MRTNRVRFYEKYVVDDGREIIKPLFDTETLGLKTELFYIKNNYPNSAIIKKRFEGIDLDGHYTNCDVVSLRKTDNKITDVYFDVSEFFDDLYRKKQFQMKNRQ